MEMINFTRLPEGLVEEVLSCGLLEPRDITNFGSTCKHFSIIAKRNLIWKKVFRCKYPSLLKESTEFEKVLKSLIIKRASNTSTEIGNGTFDWMDVFIQIHSIISAVIQLAKRHFNDIDLDDDDFKELLNLANCFTFEMMFCVLRYLLSADCTVSNLTIKYYTRKVVQHLKCVCLSPKLHDLLAVNTEKPKGSKSTNSLLLQGAILICDWFKVDTEINKGEITDFIQSAAKLVQEHIAKGNNPTKANCNTVINALNHVFFKILKFNGNADNYYDVYNSFVDHVIETRCGIPIILCLLYCEIASHIGVHLDSINNPRHFLLRYTHKELPSDNRTSADYDSCYRFIDVYNHGILRNYTELGRNEALLKAATTKEVLSRICRNIQMHSEYSRTQYAAYAERSYNLNILMEPENESTRLHRLMLLFRQSKNFRTAMEDNQAIQTSLREQANVPSVSVMEARILTNNNAKLKKRNEPLKIKLRSADENHKVMYSVGLVMQHKRYEYLCVIRGWDNFCDMSEQWKVQMGIHRLTDGADQPYYNVLVHSDGSERYAAQESLGFYEESFEEIDHPEIGKYFHSISKPGDGVRHYIPNPQLNQQYPEDYAKTQERAQHRNL